METAALLSLLNSIAPGAILEKAHFGRSEVLSIWVEAQSVHTVAKAVKSDSRLQLGWLECLTAAQLDEAIVLTYFIRSHFSPMQLILRASVVPSTPDAEIDVPSVTSVWGMAGPMEEEAAELFGIRFTDPADGARKDRPGRTPKGWSGFPLRKTFVFPKSVFGIPHERSQPPQRPDRGGSA